MASQVSPGVVIRERDFSNAVVVGSTAIRGAIASTFSTGPVGKIVNINSERELTDTFGTPVDANAGDWLVAAEFLRYGGTLAVVRAATGVLNATVSGTGVLIGSKEDFDAGATSEKYAARYAGTSGNNLRVVLVDRGAEQILTFDKTLDATPVVNSALTFTSGKTAYVYSYDPANPSSVTVIGDTISQGDTIAETDPIAAGGFTATGTATDTYRDPGTYNFTDSVNGASFEVAVAQGNEILDGDGNGTGTYEGGVVTVTMTNAGNGYTAGDTITIPGGVSGYGTRATTAGVTVVDIVITVSSVVDAEAGVTDVTAWNYNSQQIGSTGLTYKAIAPRPGTSAFASERYLTHDEVHVAVIDESTNTVVERFTYLSKLTDAKTTEGGSAYWKDYVNEYSNYIYAGLGISDGDQSAAGSGAAAGSASTTYGATESNVVKLRRLLPTVSSTLSGGADDYAYDAGEIQAAYDNFLDTEATTVDFVLMGGNGASQNDTISKAQAVAAVANSRRDCIAFISPWTGAQVASSGGALSASDQLDNTISFFNNIASSSYVVLDSGVKYTYDRFNDKYRYIGCNGDVAGVCVSTSASQDDWFSPAGLNRGGIQNVVKLAFNPNKAQRDELYENRINPIVSFPGSGPVLFGDKTGLASPSAFDRINVRRLFLNVEKRAKGLAEGVLFEQNDSTTRGAFNSSITSYLGEVQARRGLTDFLVVCDESNNTPEVIDRNEFVAELYLKPTRSINYVTVTVTATRTGVEFNEVVGR